MRALRLTGPGGRIGGFNALFLLALAAAATAAPDAWGTQGPPCAPGTRSVGPADAFSRRGHSRAHPFCFISSKFPEAPGYRHYSPPATSGASRVWESLDARLEVKRPHEARLFSEPLQPERWLGSTSESAVEGWISYYAEGPGRSYLAKAIERSAPYVESMEKIVREEGLPPEVLALVFVESGFDMRAVSHKRAAGPWQFMPRTAGRFGLHVGRYLDERRDPELSTRAAVRYLKYLHGLFDSWPLAVASYNSGEGRVLRAIARQNTRDFQSLKLPRQTREFVPKAAAVLAILCDPGRYGFDAPRSEALDYDVVEVNGPVRLSAVASICGSSQSDLERLNPALVRGVTPPGSVSFPLRVPPGTRETCVEELSRVRYHMVARGETLSQIASRYDVSVGAIARANAISNPNRIRQGALLTIPAVVSPSTAVKAGRVLASAASRAARVIHYTVKPGDSLWRISAMFRTSVSQLARWNGLRNVNRIMPGQILKVFVPAGDGG